jgi:hypothetical protein
LPFSVQLHFEIYLWSALQLASILGILSEFLVRNYCNYLLFIFHAKLFSCVANQENAIQEFYPPATWLHCMPGSIQLAGGLLLSAKKQY